MFYSKRLQGAWREAKLRNRRIWDTRPAGRAQRKQEMVVLGPCGETGAGSEWKASAGIVLVRGAESLQHRTESHPCSLTPGQWLAWPATLHTNRSSPTLNGASP